MSTVKTAITPNEAAIKEATTAPIFNSEELAVITESAGKERAALGGKAKVIDICIAHKLTGDDLSSGGKAFEQVKDAIALGLFSTAELAIYTAGAQAAKANGTAATRNALSQKLSAYMGALRRDLNNRLGIKKNVVKKDAAKDAAKDATKDATKDTPADSIKTIDPAKDVESFAAALNLMIIAASTSEDATIKKHSKAFVKALQTMVKALV